MDKLMGSSWRSSLIGLIAGLALYFEQVGVQFPTTGAEWGMALVAAFIFALGRQAKDENVTNSGTNAPAHPVDAPVVAPKV